MKPRVLFVAHVDPRGVDAGTRMRLRAVLRGLCQVADVDVLPLESVPARREVEGNYLDALPASHRSRPAALLRWLALRDEPWEVSRRRPAPWEARARGYDVIWLSRPWLLGAVPEGCGPVVVDFDDLEDHRWRSKAEAARSGIVARLHRRNAAIWDRCHARVLAAAAAVTVCSETDRQRLDAENVWVVPNGVQVVDRPRRTPPSPVLLFHGALEYDANVDAARRLVAEVLPAVRREVPDVRVRLVGPAGRAVIELGRTPGVQVVGRVDDMAAEVAGASIVVAPIRIGSGTRIKLLEAFAARVPVVSTPVGVEGLGVEDGVHALVRETAASMAAACVSVLTGAASTTTMVERAFRHVERHFTVEHVARRAEDVLTSVLEGEPAPRGS